MKSHIEQWANILDPEILKPNLEFISLYIALYEKLEDTIISRVKDFYTIIELDDIEYQNKVLALYEHKKCPKINKQCKTLISSLIWLLNLNAITNDDIDIISNLKKERNKLTHEMFDLLTQGLPKDVHSRLVEIINVFNKIEKWWIVEVEIPTSCEIENINDADLDNVMSGHMIILQIILNIVTNGSNKDFEEVCKQFNIPVR